MEQEKDAGKQRRPSLHSLFGLVDVFNLLKLFHKNQEWSKTGFLFSRGNGSCLKYPPLVFTPRHRKVTKFSFLQWDWCWCAIWEGFFFLPEFVVNCSVFYPRAIFANTSKVSSPNANISVPKILFYPFPLSFISKSSHLKHGIHNKRTQEKGGLRNSHKTIKESCSPLKKKCLRDNDKLYHLIVSDSPTFLTLH